MAELTEGSYYIYSYYSFYLSGGADNQAIALDVKGGNDKSGTNVQLYHRIWNGDSQIWHLTKDGTRWQIICSLTGKALDVVGGTARANVNVQQYNDNNSAAQRWVIEEDARFGDVTFEGKTFTSYVVRSAAGTNFVMSNPGSTVDGTNVFLQSYITDAASAQGQSWIFYPAPILNETGAYEIVLAADTKMCLDIAGGSTANSANVQVYTRNDSDAQKFMVLDATEAGVYRFKNANSSKVIDVKGGVAKNGQNVQQYTQNSGQGQLWLPIRSGTANVDGQTVPTYIIRTQLGTNFVMDCQGGGKTAKTNIQLHTSNGSVAQKFAFVKTERYGSNLEMPGQIDHDIFTRNGYGDVTVTGLSFLSNKMHFQGRYMIRKYKNKRASYTDTSWMNLRDGQTNRAGWGDAWTSTFDASPVNGMVPVSNDGTPLSLTVTLDSTYQSADVFIEIRTFEPNYGSGYTAHGPSMRSTIKVVALPEITLSSLSLGANSEGKIGIKSILSDSFGNGTQQLRTRLLDANLNPISSWVSSVSMESWFLADDTLYRIPDNDEPIKVQYSLLTDDGIGMTLNGYLDGSISYSTSSGITIQVSDEPDDQFCVEVTGTSSLSLTSATCYMLITDIVNTKMIPCDLVSSENGVFEWRAAPPFNQNGKFFVMGLASGSTDLVVASADYYVEAHEFVWNWQEFGTTDPLNACAAVFIYPEAPPQQTRTYQTDIQFSQPSGRRYPVAFASKSLQVTMNVEAIIVDEDARYVAAGPIPNYTTLPDVKKLILLSGQGIHPIYRTPYGDWHWVGIESIDTSKLNLDYSKVSVTQRAMED